MHLKILQLICGTGRAGSTISALLLSKELSKMGHKVFIFCYPNSHTKLLAEKFSLPTILFSPKPPYLKEARILSKFCKEKSIDIVNAHHSKDRLLCILAKLFGLNSAIIFTRRNMPGTIRKGLFFQERFCNRIIAVSEAIKEALLKDGVREDKISIVYNGVDIEYIKEKAAEKVLKKGKEKIIGLVGHFYKGRKGHDILLDAFPYIKGEKKLLFLGIKKKDLDFLLKEKHIDANHIIWSEFVENPYPFYSLMDVFVLASRSEGFALSLLEAMALGVPVVASDIAPVKEIIKDGEDGLLFRSSDPISLAEKINLILQNPELSRILSERAKEKIKKFTIQETAKKTEEVYFQAIKR